MTDLTKTICVHGGRLEVIEHDSESCHCRMTFAVYIPPQAAEGPVPVMYWLSGLTCTWENFATKAGAFAYAAAQGLMIVCPDTSPRGENIPDHPTEWDFGTGAGFYLNATEEPWSEHYRMEDYVVRELPALIEERYSVAGERMITGHSMGGHGALTLAFKHPDLYRSVSAFAPICAPMSCPWGQKMLRGYLGKNEEHWPEHDAARLLENRPWARPILIDQGTADEFLTEQLKPELLQAAAEKSGTPLELRMQDGYDHSFYFISSFIGDHIDWHMKQQADN